MYGGMCIVSIQLIFIYTAPSVAAPRKDTKALNQWCFLCERKMKNTELKIASCV